MALEPVLQVLALLGGVAVGMVLTVARSRRAWRALVVAALPSIAFSAWSAEGRGGAANLVSVCLVFFFIGCLAVGGPLGGLYFLWRGWRSPRKKGSFE